MSSPLEAARDGGYFMNETVNGGELPKVYQKMVPNFKHGTNLGNIQKLHPRTRPYEYQTQEKVRFLAIPRTIVRRCRVACKCNRATSSNTFPRR